MMTNMTAATAFTVAAKTFFSALQRCRSSPRPIASKPMRITPCAAPK